MSSPFDILFYTVSQFWGRFHKPNGTKQKVSHVWRHSVSVALKMLVKLIPLKEI